MKKIYMTPATRWAEIEETNIIAESAGGVGDGGKLGNEYTGTDVSYGREISSKNLWDEEW